MICLKFTINFVMYSYQNNPVSSNIYHVYIDFFGSVNKNAHRYQTLDKGVLKKPICNLQKEVI